MAEKIEKKRFLVFNSVVGTGKTTLAYAIRDHLKDDVGIVSSDALRYDLNKICTAALEEAFKRNIVIIDRNLSGDRSRRYTIYHLRKAYPDCRIICVQVIIPDNFFARVVLAQICSRNIISRSGHTLSEVYRFTKEDLVDISYRHSLNYSIISNPFIDNIEIVEVSMDSSLWERLEAVLPVIVGTERASKSLKVINSDNLMRKINPDQLSKLRLYMHSDNINIGMREIAKEVHLEIGSKSSLDIISLMNSIETQLYPKLNKYITRNMNFKGYSLKRYPIWDYYCTSFCWTHTLISFVRRNCIIKSGSRCSTIKLKDAQISHVVWNANLIALMVYAFTPEEGTKILTCYDNPILIYLDDDLEGTPHVDRLNFSNSLKRYLIFKKLGRLGEAFKEDGCIINDSFVKVEDICEQDNNENGNWMFCATISPDLGRLIDVSINVKTMNIRYEPRRHRIHSNPQKQCHNSGEVIQYQKSYPFALTPYPYLFFLILYYIIIH